MECSGLLEALARLEERAKDNGASWRLLMYAIILSPIGVLAPLFFGEEAPWRLFQVALAFSAFLAGIAIWYGLRLRAGVRQALGASGIAQALAGGELGPGELQDALPWPWRGRVRREDNLRTALERIADNLDWYLKADQLRRAGRSPQQLRRALWLLLPAVPLAPIAALWFTRGWIELALALLAILALPLPFAYYRRQVWHEELARYLRKVLCAEDPRASA